MIKHMCTVQHCDDAAAAAAATLGPAVRLSQPVSDSSMCAQCRIVLLLQHQQPWNPCLGANNSLVAAAPKCWLCTVPTMCVTGSGKRGVRMHVLQWPMPAAAQVHRQSILSTQGGAFVDQCISCVL
jgi:hypothetical protein